MNPKLEKEIESIFRNIYRRKLQSIVGLRRVRVLKTKHSLGPEEIYRIRKRIWAQEHKDSLSKYYKKKRAEDAKNFDFRPANGPKRRDWSLKDMELFLRLQEKGLTAKELAKHLKCSLPTVGYHRRRLHLSRRILGAGWSPRRAIPLLVKSETLLKRMIHTK